MTGRYAVPDDEEIRPSAPRTSVDVIHAKECPRCRGYVLESCFPREHERALCVNCGWRRLDIPDDVQAQVQRHLGRRSIEETYTRRWP